MFILNKYKWLSWKNNHIKNYIIDYIYKPEDHTRVKIYNKDTRIFKGVFVNIMGFAMNLKTVHVFIWLQTAAALTSVYRTPSSCPRIPCSHFKNTKICVTLNLKVFETHLRNSSMCTTAGAIFSTTSAMKLNLYLGLLGCVGPILAERITHVTLWPSWSKLAITNPASSHYKHVLCLGTKPMTLALPGYRNTSLASMPCVNAFVQIQMAWMMTVVEKSFQTQEVWLYNWV